ncbi:MAG: response regulator transcription factor [Nitrosopumilus sp.]|nr:response regulator transcription factor [Nitrosopumilus sp.]NNL58483.1 response regulator transcription factor [Nitrosopumilus sp.]
MNIRVILIDDYHDVTGVISEFLGFNSIDVIAIGRDGKEAVELYEKHLPDVVVMDYLMPKFSGLYGLENILKINPNAKVIMLTGSTDDKLDETLKKAGASEILPKPSSMNIIMETIKKVSMKNSIPVNN